jgi:thiol-disulfide isomerase/thioredoxin
MFLSAKNKRNYNIIVVLSDWCPACLEYKAVLNKVISLHGIAIVFLASDNLSVGAIPSTFFIKGRFIRQRKRMEGFMTYREFMEEYFLFFNKDEKNKVESS